MTIFTTHNIVESNAVIVKVFCNDDGYFEFLDANSASSNKMLTTLGQIAQMDNSVLKAMDLKPGSYAERDSVNSPWIVKG
ncbi:MAG: hypothetical protein ABIP51_10100 [Bacteroidia bacterium]